MTVSVTTDLTAVSTCDSTTDGGTHYRLAGTSSGNPAADSDAMVQNNGCIANKCGATALADVGGHFNHTSTFDLTSKMLYYWRQIVTPGNMLEKVNLGITLGLTNTSTTSTSAWSTTNYKKWYMDGKDTMPITPGWVPYCLDPTQAADASAGTLTLSTVKNIGFICRQGSGITTTVSNQFYDGIRMGTGVTLTASSGADVATMDNIYSTDNISTNRWGILTKQLGIFYAAGKINIGATNQTNACNFTDSNQVLIWRKNKVAVTFYEFNLQGASGNKTTQNLTGWVIRGEQGQKWNINCGTYGDWKSYGCSMSDINSAALSSTSIISGGAISASGTITTNGAQVTGVSLSGQTATCISATPAQMASVTGNTFTSPGTGHAVDLGTVSSTQSMTWNNNDSGYAATNGTTGNETIKVTIQSPNVLTISVAAGKTTPTVYKSGTGTVNVVSNQVTVEVTILDDATGNALQYAHVYLCKVSDKSQILSGETNAQGVVSTTLDYSADTPIMGWARQMDLSATDYEAKNISGTIKSTGFSTTVRLSPI